MQQDINMLPLIEMATKAAMKAPLSLDDHGIHVYAMAALAELNLNERDRQFYIVAFQSAYERRSELIRKRLEMQGKE